MRLGQITNEDGGQVVACLAGLWRRLDFPGDMRDLIRSGIPPHSCEAVGEPVQETSLTFPVMPGKIVAIGLNYMDHIRETGMAPPTSPLVFSKFTTSVIGPVDTILVDPTLTERVDWEGELAVVLGQRLKDVSLDVALEGVFGYTAANDVSARDIQFGDGQWVRGKSLDTFCPLGPAILTADEISDIQALTLTTFVNGEVMQASSTSEMIFGVAELISFCSRNFTLLPGDVILTGTPWGCGEFMTPKRSLRDGDVVEVAIEGIGRLRNAVGFEP
jgi:2-keto-4-pentenoate hydratase/2-oxohepta-3-ene-1,7-dioic acid hydratase in catechol pathway